MGVKSLMLVRSPGNTPNNTVATTVTPIAPIKLNGILTGVVLTYQSAVTHPTVIILTNSSLCPSYIMSLP
jgi:hypothetical protein